MTKTIYFDESGFTGYNYLDPLQPIFTLASRDITPDLSEKTLRIHFQIIRGRNLSFPIYGSQTVISFLTSQVT
jgi:hypothetical protein